ncbi:hypothetical protein AB0F77_35480 [Streptomyces sp. NPDC026672]|uniref:hypothetical protein n=1 Tax=unclassified Streptomyces TaxID=2593676 RepID=UPI00341018FB
MQWTNESGVTYDRDPYGGVGYAYAFDNGYSEVSGADAVMPPWDAGELPQWTHSTGDAYAVWADPYATGADPHAAASQLHAAGAEPVTTAWDAPFGDVLTVPPTELAPSVLPLPALDAPQSAPVRPVFVDPTGRRQRRVLRAARLLVLPAGGYVALLISTVLGGPSLSAPFVPQPDSPHPAPPRTTAPDASPGTGHTPASTAAAARTEARTDSRPSPTRTTSGSTGRPTVSAPPGATPVPTAVSTPVPAPAAPSAPASRGHSAGSTHNPVK